MKERAGLGNFSAGDKEAKARRREIYEARELGGERGGKEKAERGGWEAEEEGGEKRICKWGKGEGGK